MIRAEFRRDGDACERCGRPLAAGEIARLEVFGRVDVVVGCRCGRTTIVPWIATEEAA